MMITISVLMSSDVGVQTNDQTTVYCIKIYRVILLTQNLALKSSEHVRKADEVGE